MSSPSSRFNSAAIPNHYVRGDKQHICSGFWCHHQQPDSKQTLVNIFTCLKLQPEPSGKSKTLLHSFIEQAVDLLDVWVSVLQCCIPHSNPVLFFGKKNTLISIKQHFKYSSLSASSFYQTPKSLVFAPCDLPHCINSDNTLCSKINYTETKAGKHAQHSLFQKIGPCE